MMKDWYTHFGAESEVLREELAGWNLCLTNRSSPWEEYCALMAGRLVALDKRPGVCPVTIRKVILRLIEKLVQDITSHQA